MKSEGSYTKSGGSYTKPTVTMKVNQVNNIILASRTISTQEQRQVSTDV